MPNNNKGQVTRAVLEDQRETFVSVMKDLRAEKKSSVFGSSFLKNMLEDTVITEMANDLEYIFTVDHIMDNYPILDRTIALEILAIIDDLFGDIKEASDSVELLASAHYDKYFPDYYDSSSSSEDSF